MKLRYTEEQIVEGVRLNDKDIWKYLWEMTLPEVKKRMRRKWSFRRWWDFFAEDQSIELLTDAFYNLQELIKKGKFTASIEGSCRNFLLKQCYNKSITAYHKEKKQHQNRVEIDDAQNELQEDSSDIEEKMDQIMHCLSLLGKSCENIIMLAFEGYSNAEIASQLNFTENYVGKRKSNCIDKLQILLKQTFPIL